MGAQRTSWSSWLLLAIGITTFVKLTWITAALDLAPHPVHRASLAATASVLMVIGTALLWPAGRSGVAAAIICNFLVSSVALIDRVHWRYSGDVASLSEVAHAWQLWPVAPSLWRIFRPVDGLLYLDVVLAAVIWCRLPADGPRRPSGARLRQCGVAAMLALSLAVWPAALIYSDPDDVFAYSTTRREVAVALGLLPYHLYDLLIQATFPWSGRMATTSVQRDDSLRLLQNLRGPSDHSPLDGVARGRNVVLIMCESLQAFPIGLAVNGQQVTPHLSAFAAESLDFVNAYDQTYLGTTSDGEFTSLQSLHPLPSGAVSTRYGANDYFALPAILGAHGYDTMSAAAEAGDFWNKRQMHRGYGFRGSHFGDAFRPGERLGLGLADNDFFAQVEPKITTLEQPFLTFLITLSNHHPYALPPQHRALMVGALEGTLLGNYLQSVHHFDAMLGGFLQALRVDGVLDRSVVVVYGDHAAFWEDVPLGSLLGIADEDSFAQWRARKALALMIRLPGGAHAGPRLTPAGQLDIAPTVLRLLGIDGRREAMMGRDLTSTADPLVVLRDGSFVTTDAAWIELGAERGCYDLVSHERRDCGSLRDAGNRARQRLAVSDSVIRGNLVPWLRSQR